MSVYCHYTRTSITSLKFSVAYQPFLTVKMCSGCQHYLTRQVKCTSTLNDTWIVYMYSSLASDVHNMLQTIPHDLFSIRYKPDLFPRPPIQLLPFATHPSPTLNSKLALSDTQSMCNILAHGVAHSINCQAGSCASSQPVRPGAREETFFRSQSLPYLSCSYDCGPSNPTLWLW